MYSYVRRGDLTIEFDDLHQRTLLVSMAQSNVPAVGKLVSDRHAAERLFEPSVRPWCSLQTGLFVAVTHLAVAIHNDLLDGMVDVELGFLCDSTQ